MYISIVHKKIGIKAICTSLIAALKLSMGRKERRKERRKEGRKEERKEERKEGRTGRRMKIMEYRKVG